MSAAEFRAQQAQPKQPVGPKAPRAICARPPADRRDEQDRERFLEEYIAPRQLTGDIVWWAFEGIKLRLAEHVLDADFAVMWKRRRDRLFDVKGAKHLVEDDSRAKLKIAADKYPFPIFLAWPEGKDGFHVEPVGRQ
jgi:hypothetical protein